VVQGSGSRRAEVIGAGLAGCEAALQCARFGVPVRLFEMRPGRMTEAHETGDVAELVCPTRSSRTNRRTRTDCSRPSYVFLVRFCSSARSARAVPGGKALVVDRRRFSVEVQSELARAGVSIERAEVSSLPPAAAWYRARSVLSDPHQPTVDLGKLTVIPGESDESRNLSGETAGLSGPCRTVRIATLPGGHSEGASSSSPPVR